MSSIKWGIYLREPYWSVGKLRDLIEHAEENFDYYGIYTNDHLTGFDKKIDGKEPYLEAWTFITAVLTWSKKLHAGHTVLCQSFRNPALLGKMVSSLDHLSQGRFDLFLGAGWKEDEYPGYGYPFPSPRQRLRELQEVVTILRNLFDPNIEEWDFRGEFWTLKNNRNFPKPITQPFPIHLGGSKSKFIKMTAQIADGFNTGGESIDETIKRFNSFDDEVKRNGMDPSKKIKSYFGGIRMFQSNKDAIAYAKEIIANNEEITIKKPEELVKNQLWGTSEVIAEKIRKIVEIGVRFIILKYQSNFTDDPLTLFWDEIRPLI
jgi:alkanesulfonate monooxygenase SsuD/methylene tetrahydromethanopterin reductase-like flavin-dependent oxidoreductase (luciferase family)